MSTPLITGQPKHKTRKIKTMKNKFQKYVRDNNQIDMVSYMRDFYKMSFRIVTPWKRSTGTDDYIRGWNDCLKELKDNKNKYSKCFEKEAEIRKIK